MELGVTLRNMGPQSDVATLREGARAAEALDFESLWITDHLAIPPDDSAGSGGRYTDPLTTLAWLGGMTRRIKLGVGVLIVPYRPPLPTAKAVATVQELTGNRLLLGLAVGWMEAEFRALGVDRHRRGRITDETLAFLAECFAADVVTRNGQPFLFKPRPPAPPIYVGGAAPHALRRALRFGHGWLPMVRDPEALARDLELYRELARQAGGEPGPVTVMAGLPLDRPDDARGLLDRYRALGVERLICALRYADLDGYLRRLDQLAQIARLQERGS
ncbi:MAG: TIGR03619 family F420-dependent LLM class oxidoreductase [Pseudomonadales bacterium]